MSRLFYHVMQDNAGNLLFDVSGTMRLAGTGTLATIYGDESLSVILPNPMTNHPSFGSFKCYLGPGSYDFAMAKAGYTFETLTGIQGLGSMALQNADTVAIVGGTIGGLTAFGATGTGQVDGKTTLRGNPAGDWGLEVYPGRSFIERLAVGTPGVIGDVISAKVSLRYNKGGSEHGLVFRPGGSDTGAYEQLFFNMAGTIVGSISSSATATAYNTASDARLKFDVEDLTGELDLVKALRPVAFKWVADDSPGVGFLAHEVAAHVQGVIVGEEGAVDDEGAIKPQMIDYSKLVPYLVGAIKTLTARLAVLEDALGI